MNEIKMNRIRMAKRFLEEKGIKVYQKDIKNVVRHGFSIASPDGEMFDHREMYLVEMKDGKKYEILRETVNENGAFSLESGRYVVKDVREVE